MAQYFEVHPDNPQVRLLKQAAALLTRGAVVTLADLQTLEKAIPRYEKEVKGKKTWLMESFYRQMRRKHRVLMDGSEPVGERWNYDAENRESFGKQGPGFVPAPRRFLPDAGSRAALRRRP